MEMINSFLNQHIGSITMAAICIGHSIQNRRRYEGQQARTKGTDSTKAGRPNQSVSTEKQTQEGQR